MIEIDTNEMQRVDGGNDCSDFWNGAAIGLGFAAAATALTGVGGAGFSAGALVAKSVASMWC